MWVSVQLWKGGDYIKSNNNTEIQELSRLFSALGSTARIKIIYNLKTKEKSVLDLAKLIDCETSLISHHLNILYAEKIVSFKKIGRYKFYYLNNLNIIDTINETFKNMII